jgi:hypothetical protein
VFERKASGTSCVAADGESGDLDELALSSSGNPRLLLGARDVAGGGDVVAGVRGQDGEQGLLDGEMGHGASVRRRADVGLTRH